MPSSKRQRELARRRMERQAQRRAEVAARRRKRTLLAATGSVVAVLLIVGGTWALPNMLGDDEVDPKASASPSASATPSGPPAVACGGRTPPSPKQQTFPSAPPMTLDTKKTYTATLTTSCGPISFTLFDDKAPKTANSFAFLASKDFYDNTFCHRMTSGATLTVLQCGDPTGTGSGGPGYTLAEENLAGAKYTRGAVAMAKTQQPNSTSSQFFLVGKDSQLPPEYTLIGQMDQASLTVLDKIMAIGIDPANSPGDGAPKQRVYIYDFTVKS